MAKVVKDLKVSSVDVVDRGAGENCRVLLLKRHGKAKEDGMSQSVQEIVGALAADLMKSDRTLTKEQAAAAAFSALGPGAREILKASERAGGVSRLELEAIAKANAPKAHLEEADSERERRGYAADDPPLERDESPAKKSALEKLNARAAKLVKKGKFPTHAQAFDHVLATPRGQELFQQDKAARGLA